MTVLAGSHHLGDDDLIRYMDHQLDRESQRLMGAHLRTCPACSTRLQAFEQRAAHAREWLSMLPAELPDPGKRAVALAALERARFRSRPARPLAAPWLKAAAAVVLLVSGGMATEPGRAFMARGVVRLAGNEPGTAATRLVQWLGQEQVLKRPTLASAAGATQAPPAPATLSRADAPAAAVASERRVRPARQVKPGMSAPVAFDPQGPDVTLRFDSLQETGSVSIWIREAANASGQATARYAGEQMEATPDGLEVHNHRASRADYTISVPARYRFIRMRVAESPEILIRITKTKDDFLWTIGLQNSALQQAAPDPTS